MHTHGNTRINSPPSNPCLHAGGKFKSITCEDEQRQGYFVIMFGYEGIKGMKSAISQVSNFEASKSVIPL